MPVYASFLKPTPEGNKDMKHSRERFETGKKNVEKHGGKILSAYYIVSKGEYLILAEFHDDAERVKSIARTLEHGTVTYEVYQAIPVDDFFNIIEGA